MPDKLMVIGNGPSLRGFDFTRLRGVDTLGMNAAYRHWDRIGWYPDIYVCLDYELTKTHWKQIVRLVEDGCVRQAFLLAQFLDFVPEAARDPRYRFLDSFVEERYASYGQKFGLERIVHPAFFTSNPDKLTTGSYAARYGIWRGYTRIALMGIDLKYVERIPEARSAGGRRLEIVDTPVHNPNYFFDDYQRAGDTFHVPNPDGDMHLDAFRTLRDDAVLFDYGVSIVNTNRQSALHEEGVLPYQLLDDYLGEPWLASVVVPTNVADIEAAFDNLWLWDQPAFAPCLHQQNRQRPTLIYWFNDDSGRAVAPAIEAAFARTRIVKECFSRLEFRYEPNQPIEMTESGADLGRFFYMEPDCVPIRVDWLGQLQDLARTAHPAAVLDARGIKIQRDAPESDESVQDELVRQILKDSPTTYLVQGPAFRTAVRRLRNATRVPAEPVFLEAITEAPSPLGRTKTAADEPPDLEHRVAALESALAALDADTTPFRRNRLPDYGLGAGKKQRYWQMVRDVSDVIAALVPHDATVLVITRGDNLLLNLDGRRAWHFPRAANGNYAGHHPADSEVAINELEMLRAQGADFLVVPDTANWWFTYYRAFTLHLDRHYTRLETPACCAIYRLVAPALETVAPSDSIAGAAALVEDHE